MGVKVIKMINSLIAMHAITGILAIFAFLLVFVELLTPTEKIIKRIQIFAYIGTILIFISWIVGGYYYVNYYGADVKPIIKQGSTPWVHSIIMETKEHVFLFLPFLAILTTGIIFSYADLLKNHKAKSSVLILCALIVLIGLAITGMGYLISTGARAGVG